MSLPTRIVDADEIDKISAYLGQSEARRRVFECVYRGGNKPKDAAYIASRTVLTQVRVLQVATPMAHKGFIGESTDKGRKAFLKQKDLVPSRDRILRAAKNPKRLKELSDARLGKIDVTVHVKARQEIRVTHITIDAIENFSKARKISTSQIRNISPKRLRENTFKYGIAHILGDQGTFIDWGGEKNDLYTDHLKLGGKRYRGAIALKGIGTHPPLTIRKLGKRGDQIAKLFSSAAEVFLIQFEGQIDEEVTEQMQVYAVNKSKETGKLIYFGTIAAEDSARLRTAYPNSFRGQ
jgi:hypothetical protein